MALPKPLLVVGAIVVDDLVHPTKVLAARRTGPAPLAGMWEFPGGKVESGETPKAALIREIEEELAASIDVGPEVLHASGAWPISEMYEMRLFFAAVTDGEPTAGNSHDQLRWIAPADLDALDWLPSDTGAIASIQARLASWIP